MSLTDATSEASLPDILEANVDISVLTPGCVLSTSAAPNVDLNHSLSPPTSPYASPLCDELPMLGHHAIGSSDIRGVVRRARSSARHNAYSVPSREQRQAFKQRFRLKKHMFADDPCDHFVTSAPTTVSSAFDRDQASTDAEVASMPKSQVEPYLSTLFSAQCNVMASQSAEMETTSDLMTPARTSQKSGLTIKIPGLVDRLALRLIGSCNVTEQIEEDEDADSLDGYSASESSSDSDGYSADFNLSMQSPDRFSRRKLRRHAISPYHRTGKPRRKEWWLGDSEDEKTGSEVPDFLLLSSATKIRTRKLRSGHFY
jgi:hypothetical protein